MNIYNILDCLIVRLSFGVVIAALVGALAVVVLVTCVPETRASQRDAWQLGVCLEDEVDHLTTCVLRGAPWPSEQKCLEARDRLRTKINVGRVRCAKVAVDAE